MRNTTIDDIQCLFPDADCNSLQPVALQEFAVLSNRLGHLEKFVKFIMDVNDLNANFSVFWGGIGLTIKVNGLLNPFIYRKETRY